MTHQPGMIPSDGQPQSYDQMLRAASSTGRCPVWVHGGGVIPSWQQWDAADALARLEECDAATALSGHWPGPCVNHDDCMAPFGIEFPGLLPRPAVDRAAAVRHATEVGFAQTFGELVVVPVSRPSDILAAIGWTGACNYQRDVVELSAVLRSWEERFGALLVAMSFSTLELSVAAPPTTPQESLRVAAEHIAFCCDAFETYTGQITTDSLPEYAGRLLDRPTWRFWWD